MPDEAATGGASEASTPGGELSLHDAVALLGTPPKPPKNTSEPATVPEGDDGAARRTESGDEPDAAADEHQPPGETEEADPAEEPTVEPPRSWTPDEKEAYKLLPREHQLAIAERERTREADYRRGHDEAASRFKAAEAREQAAEQARRQYEQALPRLLQDFQSQIGAKYQDLKTWDDVSKMAREDPIRYMEWTADNQKVQHLAAQNQAAQGRQMQQAQQRFNSFQEAENKRAQEKIPDLRDPQKAAALRDEARAYLSKELGFSPAELQGLSTGSWQLSGLDHRVQMMLWKAMRYDKAQKAVKAPTPAPVPPVQRPGPATSKGEQRQGILKDLEKNLDRTGSLRDAAKLFTARSRRA